MSCLWLIHSSIISWTLVYLPVYFKGAFFFLWHLDFILCCPLLCLGFGKIIQTPVKPTCSNLNEFIKSRISGECTHAVYTCLSIFRIHFYTYSQDFCRFQQFHWCISLLHKWLTLSLCSQDILGSDSSYQTSGEEKWRIKRTDFSLQSNFFIWGY